MNKFLLLLFIGISLLSFSCRKDKSSFVSADDKYGITLEVNNLPDMPDMEEAVPGASGYPLTSELQFIHCRVYDSKGKLVFKQDQDRDKAAFGTIKTSLPSGDYTAVFVGTNATIDIIESLNLVSAGYSFSEEGLDDTFYKKLPFTVAKKTLLIELALERSVAGLNITIEDEIPEEVSRIELHLVKDHNSFSFANDARSSGILRVINFPLEESDYEANGKILFSYVFNVSDEMEAYIFAYDESGLIIYEKELKDLKFSANKMLNLAGKLFSADTEFEAEVDEDWDTPPPVVPF